ncbi:LuxR family transcriptional regulator [Actinomycetospora sp. OC33-EN08]|uniref:LuxR family transcriptional regulator n=1 Tax=Actinomycetospora aurantiaca TaxID=3129233 RepID=A0ABU8MFN3_9PSEU
MTLHHVPDLVEAHLAAARAASSQRSSATLSHQGELRQTLIALAAGAALHEHAAPRAAILHVLQGTARLVVGEDGVELPSGTLTDVPHRRHGLQAVTDVAVVLTVLAD